MLSIESGSVAVLTGYTISNICMILLIYNDGVTAETAVILVCSIENIFG